MQTNPSQYEIIFTIRHSNIDGKYGPSGSNFSTQVLLL